MLSDYQLSFEVTSSYTEYDVCLSLNNLFDQKYHLIRFIIHNKTHWGIYKEVMDLSNLFSNIRYRIFPCIKHRTTEGLLYITPNYKNILEKSIVFDTIYDCIHYSVTNDFPQIFIDDINDYFTNSINMDYIK